MSSRRANPAPADTGDHLPTMIGLSKPRGWSMQTPADPQLDSPARSGTSVPLIVFRVLVVVLVIADFVDTAVRGDAEGWALWVAIMSVAATITALRYPLAGVAIGIVPILSIIFLPSQAAGVIPLVVTTIAVVARRSRPAAWAVVCGYALVLLVDVVVGTPPLRSMLNAGALLVSVLIGLAGRAHFRRSQAADARIISLADRVARARKEERAELAGELSDLLADDLDVARHRLARANREGDPTTLFAALARTRADTQTALVRLRELVTALRGSLDGEDVDPSALLRGAIDDAEDQLIGSGHPVEVTLPESFEGLNARAAGLLRRALRVGLDRLRIAAVPGCPCALTLARSREATALELAYLEKSGGSPPMSDDARHSDAEFAADLSSTGGGWEESSAAGRTTWRVVLPIRSAPSDFVPIKSGWMTRLRPRVGWLALTAAAGAGAVYGTVRAVATAFADDPVWQLNACWALVFLGIALVGWRPTVAGCLMTVGAVAALGWYQPLPVWQPAYPAVITLAALVAARRPRWLPAVLVAWIGCLLVANRGLPAPRDIIAMLVLLLVGSLAGLAAHHFQAVRTAQLDELDRLRAQEAALRELERRQLAGELHDIVAHQLSLISMQIMAHRADDLAGLRRTAAEVIELNRSAKVDLVTLVQLLEGGPTTTSRAAEADWVAPSRVVEGVAATLEAAGHVVEVSADEGLDRCSPTTRRTLTRILREASTNVVRYAPPRSAVTIRVARRRDLIDIRIGSPLAAATPDNPYSTGWGLLGLAERVQLTGGRFSAGPVCDSWLVQATLPDLEGGSTVGVLSASPDDDRIDDAEVDRSNQNLNS